MTTDEHMGGGGGGGPGRRPGSEAGEPFERDDLVALLYGELDDGAAVRARQQIDDDPALTEHMAALSRVRELFRELDDQEPPSRISAQLLAQAAAAAPARRHSDAGESTPGLWARLSRWFEPILRHPSLAAAASLVLIAGVAGALYLRKGDELTRTHSDVSLSEPSVPPAPGAGPGEGEPAEGAAPAATGETTSAAQGAQSAAAPATIATGSDEGADLATKENAAAATRKSAPRGGERAGGGGAAAHHGHPRRVLKATDKGGVVGGAAPSHVRTGTVVGVSSQELVPQSPSRAEAAPAQQAPPPPPASTGSDDAVAADQVRRDQPRPAAPAGKAAQDGASVQAGKAGKAGDVRALYQQALAAATHKDCARVRSLVSEIARSDRGFYDKVVAKDQRLAPCRASAAPSSTRK